MRMVALAIVSLALAGCASVPNTNAGGPARQWAISAPVERVRDCFQEEDYRLLVTPYGDGYRVTVPDLGTTYVTLTGVAGGTTIALYERTGVPFGRSLVKIAEKCERQLSAVS